MKNSKIKVGFTQKVYPHMAMREKFIKKIPEPKKSKTDKKDEHSFLYYRDKAKEFLINGDLISALEGFNIAIELKQNCYKTFLNRSQCYFRTMDFANCLNDIESASQFIPDVNEIKIVKGIIFNKQRSSSK